jgi:hypothetical protein
MALPPKHATDSSRTPGPDRPAQSREPGDARERVRARLRQISEHAAAFAAAASLSASCSDGKYGVVDPLPPPFVCGTASPAFVISAVWAADGVSLTVSLPGAGFGQAADIAQSVSTTSDAVDARIVTRVAPAQFRLELADAGVWPASLVLTIETTCTDSQRTSLGQFRIRLFTSEPAQSGDVVCEVLDADAGS